MNVLIKLSWSNVDENIVYFHEIGGGSTVGVFERFWFATITPLVVPGRQVQISPMQSSQKMRGVSAGDISRKCVVEQVPGTVPGMS